MIKFFKSHALRLDEDVYAKIEECMSDSWKEELQKEIDNMISNAACSNWLENPKWLRGQIEKDKLDGLEKTFNQQSHYPDSDIYILIANKEGLMKEFNDEEIEDFPTDQFIILRVVYNSQEKWNIYFISIYSIINNFIHIET